MCIVIIYEYDKHVMLVAKDNIQILLCLKSLDVCTQIKLKLHGVFLLYCSPAPISGYTHDIYHIGINNHNPTEGILTLTQWWGLRGQMILRSMLAVAYLLVGPSMPDRSRVMTQTKRDTLVLQVGGWA